MHLDVDAGARWKLVKVPADSEWIIYRNKLSRKHHCLFIFPRRDTSRFLSLIPDTVPLSSLMLPGKNTADRMAFYGWPISQCQSLSTSLERQLHSGIRVLDIRLAIVDSHLISYHGVYPERAPFAEILSTVHTFLTTPLTSRETIVVSIKQEDSDPQRFTELVRQEIVASPGGLGMWYLENRLPTLGEVRGKVVMFSRFGGNGYGWDNAAIGIHPPLWPDSDKLGFTWNCQDALVQIHDWYAIPSFLSIPEKVALSTNILVASRDSPSSTLSISFLSASSIPLAFPPTIARGLGWPQWGIGFEGVNARVGKWLLDQFNERGESDVDEDPRIRGWALMDFYEDPIGQGIVPLLVECNFRGRRCKEEGWA
ncbi:PLC-like phosphodiesterase [Suillus lakei]|nr:PLC-like phosphodiesterase [Suillus lakei]